MGSVGRLSDSRCYSYTLSAQTEGDHRPSSQFLFDNFEPFLNTSLTKFSHDRNTPSSIGGVLLEPSKKKGLEG